MHFLGFDTCITGDRASLERLDMVLVGLEFECAHLLFLVQFHRLFVALHCEEDEEQREEDLDEKCREGL